MLLPRTTECQLAIGSGIEFGARWNAIESVRKVRFAPLLAVGFKKNRAMRRDKGSTESMADELFMFLLIRSCHQSLRLCVCTSDQRKSLQIFTSIRRTRCSSCKPCSSAEEFYSEFEFEGLEASFDCASIISQRNYIVRGASRFVKG